MTKHPGSILLHDYLETSGKSRAEFAQMLGWSVPKLSKVLHGLRDLHADAALELAKALKTTPEYWLQLQAEWDLHEATQRQKNAKVFAKVKRANVRIDGRVVHVRLFGRRPKKVTLRPSVK